ncbi:UBX domain-containing protein 11, partial [Eschrichtius robustus]|nr:UBX domain-containing protein 11 [Eschrichtius robustus]
MLLPCLLQAQTFASQPPFSPQRGAGIGHPGPPREPGWEKSKKRPVLVGSLLSSIPSFLSSYAGGTENRLLHLDQGPGPPFRLGFSPRAVTWASLSAEDEVDVLKDAHGSEERISVPSCYGGIGAPDFVWLAVPVYHDPELMAAMARKVRDLERQVKAQADEMLSKDRKIRALEELVETLQEHQGTVTLQRQEELETMCAQLQRQVGEMERFLGDYGLQWVGEPMDKEDSEDGERDWMTAKKFWKPGSFVANY